MTREQTDELKGRVARHYSAPEWFTTFELPIWGAVETEDGKDRQIDALAISRVASRSNEIVGVETKVDRSDWLRELQQQAKASAWIRLVDRYVVAAPKGVVKKEELPIGWGLLEESGGGLRTAVQGAVLNPWRDNGGHDPIPRELWVRILRRTLDHDEIRPLLSAEYARGHQEGSKASNEGAKREAADFKDRFDRLATTVHAFEKASGIKLLTKHLETEWAIGEWNARDLGAAIKVLNEHKDLLRTATQDLRNLRRCGADLEKVLREAGVNLEAEL